MVNLTCVVSGTNAPPKHIFWYHEEKVRQKVDIFSFFLSFFLQVISYYSNRNGLGGVSIVTEKGEVTVSQLLIKGATIEDQVRKILNLVNMSCILTHKYISILSDVIHSETLKGT